MKHPNTPPTPRPSQPVKPGTPAPSNTAPTTGAQRQYHRPPRAKPGYSESPDAIRLSKRVMEVMTCSRAEAEQYIEAGRVTVNGVRVQDPPARVVPRDLVEVHGEKAPKRIEAATLLLHKPAGCNTQAMLALLTEANHLPNDRSGLTLLKKHLSGLQCLTPLEPAASGLVVWSQHPGIARKLQEDATGTEHEALAQVRGAVSPEALKRLNTSAVVDGRAMLPARVSINQSQPEFTRLRFALKGYHPGQIVQLCEQAGLDLMALHRVRMGRLPLASLPVGQWRFLLGYERF